MARGLDQVKTAGGQAGRQQLPKKLGRVWAGLPEAKWLDRRATERVRRSILVHVLAGGTRVVPCGAM